MIKLSDEARVELDEYFADKEKSPIRVFMARGCSGARLALALDAAGDEDKTFNDNDYTFIIGKDLLDATGAISISLSDYGFEVDSENPLPEISGGCSGCPSAAGCGH